MKDAIIWVLLVMLCVLAVIGIEVISTAAMVALLTCIALYTSWSRIVPEKWKYWLTTRPGLVLIDLSLWYLGWVVVRDAAASMKVSFVMTHILLIPGMAWERKRLRGQLWFQRRRDTTPSVADRRPRW